MKSQDSIPVSRISRASEFLKTGARIGTNYLRHYARRVADPESPRELLHQENAGDIYRSLSKLKGSALKVAQMMSMDRSFLPRAYAEQFQMGQYSAPPLSGPLVVKTFMRYMGKSPGQIFDRFDLEARNAASIGQVHEAWKDGRRLAVKIQYPGVADSIRSDLKMVKPFATRLFGLNEADVDRYTAEVEARLLEETDYRLEMERSLEISGACSVLEDLVFPAYYPELSSQRILTMEWLPGLHLKEFLETAPSQEVRDRIGQALWDFYEFQIHTLRKIHADPHPGNFLIQEDGRLGIIDFGCVKEIPLSFYRNYFALINPANLEKKDQMLRLFYELEFLYPNDTAGEKAFFVPLFRKMIEMLGVPFQQDTFDFGDDRYFDGIYAFTEELAAMPELRESKVARGSKDGLYVNRTYFGLYSLLNQLKARVRTHSVFREMVLEEN